MFYFVNVIYIADMVSKAKMSRQSK